MYKKNIITFDIGASNGYVSKNWLSKYPHMIIYAFEPNKINFESLSKNTVKNDNIYIYNQAISSKKGTFTFYEANYTNSSSLLPFVNTDKWINPHPTIPELKTLETYDVNCIRLDDFMIENKIECIDFLKIDTQGHDLEVIKSLGNMITCVKEIIAEVQIVDFELYKGAGKKSDMVKYMELNGFEIYKLQKYSQNQEENIWFINTLYEDYLHLGL